MTTLRNSRSGQSAIEYILLSTMVTGVVLGILAPRFQDRFSALQDRMAQSTVGVLAQDEMGIPECWFFCGADQSFASVDARLAAARGGGGSGGPGGGSDGNKDRGKGNDKGLGGPKGPLVASNGGINSPNGPTGGGGLGRKGSNADSTDDSEEAARRNQRGASRGGGAGGIGGAQTDEEARRQNAAKDGAVEGGDKKPDDNTGAGVAGRRRFNGRTDQEQTSGCARINLFLLLKILAILAVLILGGALALTGRNRNER